MRKQFLRLWLVPAMVFLFAGIVVNISAWSGQATLDSLTWILHAGVAVVWLPVVWICYGPLTEGFNVFAQDSWRILLRGCPRWMRNTLYVVFGYFLLNMLATVSNKPETNAHFVLSRLRVDSGFWIFTFYASVAVLISARRLEDEGRLEPRRCPRGHVASKEVYYCDTCGARMADRPERV